PIKCGAVAGAHQESLVLAYQEAHWTPSAGGSGSVGSHRVGSRRGQVLCDDAGIVVILGKKIDVAVAVEMDDRGARFIGPIDGLIIGNRQPIQRAVVECSGLLPLRARRRINASSLNRIN